MRNLFLEGDLVLRRPVLAVGQVMDNKVFLLMRKAVIGRHRCRNRIS